MFRLILGYLKSQFNKIIQNKEAVSILILGFIAGIICLALTFSVILSLVIFIFFVASAIFKESFSRGWLFLLGIALVFPFIKIFPDIYLFQLILFVIILLSILQLIYENGKFEIGKASFCFLLLALIGLSLQFISPLFNILVQKQVQEILISLTLIWFLLASFQYFFHTKKRINRFIFLLILIGLLHSIVGLLAVFGGWYNSLGIGVSSGTGYQIFLEKFGQLNGIWGNSANYKVGANSVASFLAITILLTLGRLIAFNREKQNFKQQGKYSLIYLFWAAFLIQVAALIMTHSYFTFIILGVSAIIMGILLKNKKIILGATIWSVLFSSLVTRFQIQYKLAVSDWMENFRNLNNWILGNGIFFQGNHAPISENIQNSYLFLWNYYGVFSILIILMLFYYFFMVLYNNYRLVSGENKITLITITAIFICIIIEALGANILFFGPTAIAFWLFYGIVINFRRDALEKKLLNNKIFYRILNRPKKSKSIDSIKKRVL